jgi:hypothetical protein
LSFELIEIRRRGKDSRHGNLLSSHAWGSHTGRKKVKSVYCIDSGLSPFREPDATVSHIRYRITQDEPCDIGLLVDSFIQNLEGRSIERPCKEPSQNVEFTDS